MEVQRELNNENNTGSSTSNDTTESQLDSERLSLAKSIIAVMEETDTAWQAIMDKQAILDRLHAEQIIVSDKFHEYNTTWKDVSTNVDVFFQFNEIDEDIQSLFQSLDEFEVEKSRISDSMLGIIKDMKMHMSTVRKSLELASGAKCISDLRKVSVPSLDLIHNIPETGIEGLEEKWEQMQLDTKITNFLHLLQEAVEERQ